MMHLNLLWPEPDKRPMTEEGEPDWCVQCGETFPEGPGNTYDCACRCEALLWLENAATRLYALYLDTLDCDLPEEIHEAGRILAFKWLEVSRGMKK